MVCRRLNKSSILLTIQDIDAIELYNDEYISSVLADSGRIIQEAFPVHQCDKRSAINNNSEKYQSKIKK